MKILITGGGGFLGYRLALALLKRGAVADADGKQQAISQITLIDTAFPAQTDPRLKCVKGDFTNAALLAGAMGRDTGSVFHLAAVVSGGAEADFDFGGHRRIYRAVVLALARTATVRADHRSHADEKHIRAQSAILDKTQPQTVVAFIHNHVFCTDALFIRTENMVGARRAQWSPLACAGIQDAIVDLGMRRNLRRRMY